MFIRKFKDPPLMMLHVGFGYIWSCSLRGEDICEISQSETRIVPCRNTCCLMVVDEVLETQNAETVLFT